MMDSFNIAPYNGFTEEEVIELCNKYHRDFNEIKKWYKGYTLNGISLYNPVSVVNAISRNKCKEYWNLTCSIEALTDILNYESGASKDKVFELIQGNKVSVNTRRLTNDLTKIDSEDDALTALIYLGYIKEDDWFLKYCFISNYEIKKEFVRAIKKRHWTKD